MSGPPDRAIVVLSFQFCVTQWVVPRPGGLSHVSSPVFQDMVLEPKVSCVAAREVVEKRMMIVLHLPLRLRTSKELVFVEKSVFNI